MTPELFIVFFSTRCSKINLFPPYLDTFVHQSPTPWIQERAPKHTPHTDHHSPHFTSQGSGLNTEQQAQGHRKAAEPKAIVCATPPPHRPHPYLAGADTSRFGTLLFEQDSKRSGDEIGTVRPIDNTFLAPKKTSTTVSDV